MFGFTFVGPVGHYWYIFFFLTWWVALLPNIYCPQVCMVKVHSVNFQNKIIREVIPELANHRNSQCFTHLLIPNEHVLLVLHFSYVRFVLFIGLQLIYASTIMPKSLLQLIIISSLHCIAGMSTWTGTSATGSSCSRNRPSLWAPKLRPTVCCLAR